MGCNARCSCNGNRCGNPLNNLDRILGTSDEPLEIHECFRAYIADYRYLTTPQSWNLDLRSIFDVVSFELWNLELLDDDPALRSWGKRWVELNTKPDEDPEKCQHMRELIRRAVLRDMPGRKYLFSFCYDKFTDQVGSWTKAKGWRHCNHCHGCQSGAWHCDKCHACREDRDKPCVGCGGISSTYKPLTGGVRPFVPSR